MIRINNLDKEQRIAALRIILKKLVETKSEAEQWLEAFGIKQDNDSNFRHSLEDQLKKQLDAEYLEYGRKTYNEK